MHSCRSAIPRRKRQGRARFGIQTFPDRRRASSTYTFLQHSLRHRVCDTQLPLPEPRKCKLTRAERREAPSSPQDPSHRRRGACAAGVVAALALLEAEAGAQAQWVLRAKGSRKEHLCAEREPGTSAQAHRALKGCEALPLSPGNQAQRAVTVHPPSRPFRSFEAEKPHTPWSAEPLQTGRELWSEVTTANPVQSPREVPESSRFTRNPALASRPLSRCRPRCDAGSQPRSPSDLRRCPSRPLPPFLLPPSGPPPTTTRARQPPVLGRPLSPPTSPPPIQVSPLLTQWKGRIRRD